jgi:hypothetical protein
MMVAVGRAIDSLLSHLQFTMAGIVDEDSVVQAGKGLDAHQIAFVSLHRSWGKCTP